MSTITTLVVFLLEPDQTLVLNDNIHMFCIRSGSYEWKLKDCIAVHKILGKISDDHTVASSKSLVPHPSFSKHAMLEVLIEKANEHSNACGRGPCHV